MSSPVRSLGGHLAGSIPEGDEVCFRRLEPESLKSYIHIMYDFGPSARAQAFAAYFIIIECTEYMNVPQVCEVTRVEMMARISTLLQDACWPSCRACQCPDRSLDAIDRKTFALSI